MQTVLRAFWELSNDRSIGMAVGPIPFAAIDRFCDRYGPHDLRGFDYFRDLIRACDAEYLRLTAPKDDASNSQHTASKPLTTDILDALMG